MGVGEAEQVRGKIRGGVQVVEEALLQHKSRPQRILAPTPAESVITMESKMRTWWSELNVK